MNNYPMRLVARVALAGWLLTTGVGAQTLTNLHVFQWDTNTNPSDGAMPLAGVTQGTDGLLYGTTSGGGANAAGTIFTITTNGHAYTPLWQLGRVGDGSKPLAGVIQSEDGNFYGTTSDGGAPDAHGTVYQITPGGTLTILHSFAAGTDGDYPAGGVVQGRDGDFYGTAANDGPNTGGTLFKVTASGVFTLLHAFGAGDDGAQPDAGLMVARDGYLYGTTTRGGTDGAGTVFKLIPGGGYTRLFSFHGGSNPNGGYPEAGLVQGWDGDLYGTTEVGGTANAGTVYKITTNGYYSTLYSFTGGSDGSNPRAGLLLASDGDFYGTTYWGGNGQGIDGAGTAFKITPTGTLTTVHTFTSIGDGQLPAAGLLQDELGFLYGTTTVPAELGGNILGTVFRITIPLPTVATPVIAPNGGSFANPQTVTLTCPTPSATLYYTTNGALPTISSPAYSRPFAVNSSTTIKVIGVARASYPSAVAAAAITITALTPVATPTITPPAGAYTNTVLVTLACDTTGAKIHYTTNGVEPTATSATYAKAFAVTSTSTVKAKAVKALMADSAVASNTFNIVKILPAVALPTITPNGGARSNSVTVTLGCTTAGAKIHYTITGLEPTATSPAYTKAVVLTNSCTLKAKAFKALMTDSGTAVAVFTINTPAALAITTPSLPDGKVQTVYLAGFKLLATGGVAPVKWSWAAAPGSQLPPGLVLSATTGAITGTPTRHGTFNVMVKATDTKKLSSTKPLSIIVNP